MGTFILMRRFTTSPKFCRPVTMVGSRCKLQCGWNCACHVQTHAHLCVCTVNHGLCNVKWSQVCVACNGHCPKSKWVLFDQLQWLHVYNCMHKAHMHKEVKVYNIYKKRYWTAPCRFRLILFVPQVQMDPWLVMYASFYNSIYFYIQTLWKLRGMIHAIQDHAEPITGVNSIALYIW